MPVDQRRVGPCSDLCTILLLWFVILSTAKNLLWSIELGRGLSAFPEMMSTSRISVIRITDYPEPTRENLMSTWCAFMSDQDALIAFQLGASLDQETTRRLWTSGYIEVAKHDTCPNGTRELTGKWITPKGWSLLQKAEPAFWRR